jgi:hypothetical protein
MNENRLEAQYVEPLCAETSFSRMEELMARAAEAAAVGDLESAIYMSGDALLTYGPSLRESGGQEVERLAQSLATHQEYSERHRLTRVRVERPRLRKARLAQQRLAAHFRNLR